MINLRSWSPVYGSSMCLGIKGRQDTLRLFLGPVALLPACYASGGAYSASSARTWRVSSMRPRPSGVCVVMAA